LAHTFTFQKWSFVPVLRINSLIEKKGSNTQASPRVSVVYRYHPKGHMRMHTGLYPRMPTLLERFGDGVLTDANDNLLPEQGFNSECGYTHTWTPHSFTLQHSVSVYHTQASRLIVLIQKSQNTLQASNVGKTVITGVESAFKATHKMFQTHLSYTWTHAQDRSGLLGLDGTPTPGVPAHALTSYIAVGPSWLNVSYTASWLSGMYLAKGYARPVPQRVLHSATVSSSFFKDSWNLVLHAENLTGVMAQRVPVRGSVSGEGTAGLVDYVGYPIPGRSFYISTTWRL
jgi:outer membrane receptor for ferrienterochelin and colicin